MTITDRVADLVRQVEYDPPHIGVLSTGERIAVALVLARVDLLPPGFTSISQAEGYIDPDWHSAVKAVRKARLAG